MNRWNTVAITGAAGYLGRLTRTHMHAGRGAAVRLLDIAPCETGSDDAHIVVGDLADMEAVRETVRGADLVIHLGADLSVDDWDGVLSSNIAGTYNVYEASRQEGIKRIVFASSHHMAGMYPSRTPVDTMAPMRPDSLYGVAKGFGEILGQYYWDKFGIESVALRIGSVRPQPGDRRELFTWLSEPDYRRLLDASLDAPSVGFTPVWGVSDNEATWWLNTHAAHLGFRPQDSSRDAARPPSNTNDLELLKYQGGKRALHNLIRRDK